ncbi:unnamed protein product [Brachionus calyciflorus]|uniref:Protein kinase domain-containing protein n=1 Tax=Brachionus calyciflorus TaxID=104777 RepID=A0A814GE91_9BILA|nr:unnamed protein product [Brachionus calyciflorus]
MEDIFHLIREGNSLSFRSWVECIDNDFNLVDDHGFSLLHWACWDGHLNIVEILVNKGAKINSLNKCEDTPLHNACQNNHLNVALYLLKNKANINAVNFHGNSPLHYACHYDYQELALNLIQNGALLNKCNKYNQTPIDLCRDEFKEVLIKITQNLNIDLNRIPFRQDSSSRISRQKSKEAYFPTQQNINIDELPVEKMIATNHGGTIWKGYWQENEVSIKVLKIKESSQRIASLFNQESKRLRIFNAANILPVLGTCVSLPDLIIVSPYMNLGSLYSILHVENDLDFELDFNCLVNFANGIARGMDFLHNLEPMLLNFNLNSKHVMIDDDLTPKLNMSDCKFSFSEKVKIFNPAWMAPETLRKKTDDINKKSADMWSFGVILWELFTKKVPFGEFSPMQCGILISRDGLRLELPVNMSVHIQKLIKICMNEESAKRPKFEMILPILEKLKK